MARRPIDVHREGPGQIDLVEPNGSEDAIKGFITIRDRLHVYKSKSIYHVALADEIDPERTNIEIPNTYQRILSQGSDSPIVGRTLLTAANLFKKDHFPASVDLTECLGIALDITIELVALDELVKTMKRKHEQAIGSFQIANGGRSAALPSVFGLEPDWKTFTQRAGRVMQALLDMAQTFYSQPRFKGGFPGLSTYLTEHHGVDDPFALFIQHKLESIACLKEWRNCVEHPKPGYRCVISDFRIGADGALRAPTVSVEHHQYPSGDKYLAPMMVDILGGLIEFVEQVQVGMCAASIEQPAHFRVCVAELVEGERPSSHVSFGYKILMGEDWGHLG